MTNFPRHSLCGFFSYKIVRHVNYLLPIIIQGSAGNLTMTEKVYKGPVVSTSKFLLQFRVFSLHIVRQERQTQFSVKFVLAEGYLKELRNLFTYLLTHSMQQSPS